MYKRVTATLSVAALVGALSGVAAADPLPTKNVDTMNHINTGLVQTEKRAPQPEQTGPQRPFHPDDSQALTPQQMQSAWNSEIERVFVPNIGGGG